ncbi:MAG: hypothetical protein JO352_19790 [Chloroflexi bacterium]|nr:hypothetical protein [Chloroflexota bacterium]MBV9599762.1 hypothetical protein [Chloroflexota bacterium]
MVAIQIDDRVFDSAELRQSTLCWTWLPAVELLTIARGIRWCGPCAALHPELVPPPADIIWPIAGAVIGGIVGLLIATTIIADTAVSLTGLVGSLVGALVGIGALVHRAGRSDPA